ncbi:transposase [Moraxella catarrhalis]|uniref:transposase n=1 Tax=Moraxella catarrhalis TaxID=480 RepID=UPI003F7645F3
MRSLSVFMGLSIIEFFNFTIGLIISNDLRRGRHVVYNLHVHLVFVTKYRRAVFTKQVLDGLEAIKHSYP